MATIEALIGQAEFKNAGFYSRYPNAGESRDFSLAAESDFSTISTWHGNAEKIETQLISAPLTIEV